MKLDLGDLPAGTYTLTVHENGGYTLVPDKPQPLDIRYKGGGTAYTPRGNEGLPPRNFTGPLSGGAGATSHDPRPVNPLSPEDMEVIREANPWMKDHPHG
jgi:hypothetical protein